MYDARVSVPALIVLFLMTAAAVEPAKTAGASARKKSAPSRIRITSDEAFESQTTIRTRGVTVRLHGRFSGFGVIGTSGRPRVERMADGERTTYKGRVSLRFYQDGASAVEIDTDGAVVERQRRRTTGSR